MYAQGRKNRTIKAADGSTILLNYGFLSLFWVFNFTYGYKYAITSAVNDGSTNYKAISKEEATKANNGKVVAPPVMERYSFVIFLAIFAVIVVWRMLT